LSAAAETAEELDRNLPRNGVIENLLHSAFVSWSRTWHIILAADEYLHTSSMSNVIPLWSQGAAERGGIGMVYVLAILRIEDELTSQGHSSTARERKPSIEASPLRPPRYSARGTAVEKYAIASAQGRRANSVISASQIS